MTLARWIRSVVPAALILSLAAGPCAAAPSAPYEKVDFAAFGAKASGVRTLAGAPVEFTAGIGDSSGRSWLIEAAPREGYLCVRLLEPGQREPTRNFVYGYVPLKTPLAKRWKELQATAAAVNSAGGMVVRGTAWHVGLENYPYPVGVIVERVKPLKPIAR